MNASLIPSFKESIFSDVADIAVDLGEIGIDSVLRDGLIKDIPIVSVFYKFANIATSIREQYLLKKTLIFIQEMNDGRVSDDVRNQYMKRLESDPKGLDKELEYILISIDRHLQSIKSKILARFYVAYLDPANEYNWADFCILLEILDEISIYDFDALFHIYKNESINILDNIEKISLFQIARLEKCGTVYENTIVIDNRLSSKNISVTPQGRIFCELSKIEDFVDAEE